jgi:hypothetical protein
MTKEMCKMNNVIEFKSRKEDLYERNLKLFNEFKVKDFSDTLTDSERKEYDRVYEWILIHS